MATPWVFMERGVYDNAMSVHGNNAMRIMATPCVLGNAMIVYETSSPPPTKPHP